MMLQDLFFYLFSTWDSLKNRKGVYPDSSKNYSASYRFTIVFKKKICNLKILENGEFISSKEF